MMDIDSLTLEKEHRLRSYYVLLSENTMKSASYASSEHIVYLMLYRKREKQLLPVLHKGRKTKVENKHLKYIIGL